MRVYDDLIAVKGNGTPFDKLERVDSRKLVQTSASTGSLPTDYISFLAEVGFGEFCSAGYMLYDGLLEPYEVYGDTPFISGMYCCLVMIFWALIPAIKQIRGA